MKASVLAVLALVAVAVSANPLSGLSKEELETKTWVVLAAGSDGYYNYRHQADVCHAYQVIHAMGVPEEHIIVMMKDDIANNTQNPRKGEIINEPNGPDVYKGVPHDYTGRLVTSDNFIKILTGKKMTVGSGKSLESGPDDNVFVFFDDHGSEGALCFPRGCDLNAAKMQTTLNTMAKKKMFKKLVFYVEACFAGSVFYKLVLPDNVYVTTAAPVGESSFAYNYDRTIGSYVADIYSFLWIHDTEVNNEPGRTFNDQFKYIQENIEGYSQTCQYGDKTVAQGTLTEFYNPTSARVAARKDSRIKITDAVSVFEVPLATAKRVFMDHPTDENLKELNKQIAIKKSIDNMGAAIIEAAQPEAPHLSLPACDKCDKTCNCYRYCISSGSAKFCEFECCNEQSCYEDAPTNGVSSAQRDACLHTLAQEYLNACGNDHPYLRKTELLFRRVCRRAGTNIEKAVEEIHAQCSAFNRMNF